MSLWQDPFASVSRNFPLGPSFPERRPVSSAVTVPFGLRYAVPSVLERTLRAGSRPRVSENVPTSPDGTGRTEIDDVVIEGVD